MSSPAYPWRREATYAALTTAFCVVLVLTNIVGTKLFHLFPEGGPSWLNGGAPLALTSGIITYPLTFLFTDLVSEIWGRRKAAFMVKLGFAMSVLMLGVVWMAVQLPPAGIWTNAGSGFPSPEGMQQAFAVTFSVPFKLLFASMLAYLVAQLFDVRLYHFWWKLTKGRHMWLRNNGSTAISQLVDTIIVNGIFLSWHYRLEPAVIVQIIINVYVCKLVLAMLDTPLIYLGRRLLRDFLGLEQDPSPDAAPLS